MRIRNLILVLLAVGLEAPAMGFFGNRSKRSRKVQLSKSEIRKLESGETIGWTKEAYHLEMIQPILERDFLKRIPEVSERFLQRVKEGQPLSEEEMEQLGKVFGGAVPEDVKKVGRLIVAKSVPAIPIYRFTLFVNGKEKKSILAPEKPEIFSKVEEKVKTERERILSTYSKEEAEKRLKSLPEVRVEMEGPVEFVFWKRKIIAVKRTGPGRKLGMDNRIDKRLVKRLEESYIDLSEAEVMVEALRQRELARLQEEKRQLLEQLKELEKQLAGIKKQQKLRKSEALVNVVAADSSEERQDTSQAKVVEEQKASEEEEAKKESEENGRKISAQEDESQVEGSREE